MFQGLAGADDGRGHECLALTIEPGEDAIAFEVDPVASVAVRFSR
jgi:hypothetical protein